ncbi:MAG: MFS transporter [Rhizobium sp.]|jgi:predicted MFS family arabinose efflux permease|uniref:MFS transporter n=1 Tax=Rhizobium sp. TaxID=391 RepID=UPI0030F031E9
MSSSADSGSFKPIYFLALGTFAIGTEGFMIVPLLPRMSADLSVPIAAVGSLVTMFTLTLAISTPVLTTLTGAINRRKLLIWSMLAFAAANLVAFASRDYWGIMVARILLALSAGLYAPNANALASAIVSPERRGRALSVVNGGITLAIALGLPLGSLIGDAFGWRMTFLGVGILSLIAVTGLVFGLQKGVGDQMKVASFKERVAVVGNPQVLAALLVTFIWAAGAYTAWTYIAPYLASTIGASSNGISAIVSIWGLSAAAGVFGGGALNDRVGANTVMAPALTLLAMAFLTLSASAYFLTPCEAIAPVVISVIVWGLTAWGFYPLQISRLIEVGGRPVAPIVVSLNTSFMYAGFAVGATVGSVVISSGSVADLGWIGALFEVVALGLLVTTTREAGCKQAVQS